MDFSTGPDVTNCVVRTEGDFVGSVERCTSDVDNCVVTAGICVDISAISEVLF